MTAAFPVWCETCQRPTLTVYGLDGKPYCEGCAPRDQIMQHGFLTPDSIMSLCGDAVSRKAKVADVSPDLLYGPLPPNVCPACVAAWARLEGIIR